MRPPHRVLAIGALAYFALNLNATVNPPAPARCTGPNCSSNHNDGGSGYSYNDDLGYYSNGLMAQKTTLQKMKALSL